MRDNYDFPNARKNPFLGTLKGVHTIIIEHDGYNEVVRIDNNKTPPLREVLEITPVSQKSDAFLKRDVI